MRQFGNHSELPLSQWNILYFYTFVYPDFLTDANNFERYFARMYVTVLVLELLVL